MIIQIPFSFDYRTAAVRWAEVQARITGWGRRTNGAKDGSALVAWITTDGLQHPIRYPRQRLPEGRWDNLWLEAYTDEDVERVFSGFEPVLLVPLGDTWVDPEEFKKHSRPADAWQLREEFLRVEPSSEAVLAFLNKWGRWNFMEFVDLAEIVRLQGAVREALTESPERWFQSPYSFPPTWGYSAEYPFFTFLTDQCEIAIRLTVTVDLLKGLKFTRCARPDCGQLFALGARRVKKFCSRDCTHLEAVRRSRKKTERNGAE
jgi:hypothetical protein